MSINKDSVVKADKTITKTEPPKNAGMIVGDAPMQCKIHEPFPTFDNMDDFNKHCHETGHKLEGITKCQDCDKLLVFKNIPHHDFTPRGIPSLQLRCTPCRGNHEQKMKLTNEGTILEAGKYGQQTTTKEGNQ